MRKTLIALSLLIICHVSLAQPLWQIGTEDGQYKEFALVNEGYRAYQNDPLFVVGTSNPAKDWPFIHPGPVDRWAGQRTHTFTIIFALANKPAAGDCALHVALADTHPSDAPFFNVLINGKQFDQQTPSGIGGDQEGPPETGKPYKFDIHFSSALLNAGPNFIQIVNSKGSWALYDALSLSTPPGAHLQKLDSFTVATARNVRALVESNGKPLQPIELKLWHSGAPVTATIQAEGISEQRQVDAAESDAEILIPPVKKEKNVSVSITANGQTFTTSVMVEPVRHLTIYLLHHSHHDLGYTNLQADVEAKQMENLRKAVAIAKKTADYPPGAKFVWNTEVLWSTDQFMHQASKEDRQAFIEAVKKGQIALNGTYANELTGLCRPEEMLQLCRYGTQLEQQLGIKIDTAVQSDVPGMTWGLSTAFAQAGIRYFSLAPNWFDRIGSIMVTWQDKPFWWISPSGKDKILVWIPYSGYALSHVIGHLNPEWVTGYEQRLDDIHFPYDITYLRWAGHGDNAEPDPEISEFVKNWNSQYAWPKFCIASTHDIFSAFEKRYGDKLPKYKGDLTPYWEDGAASSALETAISRNNAERLVQAEAIFAMQSGKHFPADAIDDVWRKILLYSEHTWGAYCSVSQSEWAFTKAQWAFKQAFALDGKKDSEKLLDHAVALGADSSKGNGVFVYNTTSWPRTELVVAPKNLTGSADNVADSNAKPVVSQRLANGDLAILAKEVPPYTSVRFNFTGGQPNPVQSSPATANGNILDNGLLHVEVDKKTGGISHLTLRGISGDFAKSADGEPLNDYVYLPGSNLADIQGSSAPKITVTENGPLVAELRIESQAAGCNSLVRNLRLVAGSDYVQIADTIDKKRVALNPDPNDTKAGGPFAQHGSKESVSFAFPFNVEDGQIRLDIPLGNMRPEIDQLPGACKNWLPVGRYADVSNKRAGVTLAILDAPLVEIGQLSTLLGSQRNPTIWRQHIEPTQKIYSWVMNNHWGTNYRAYQEGIVDFRYALRPHAKYDPADAARFSTALSQPLVVSSTGTSQLAQPLLRVEPSDVLVECLKPSDDGHAWIVRLFGASGKDRKVKLTWASPAPTKISISDLAETAGPSVGSKVKVPAWGLVTLRAEYP